MLAKVLGHAVLKDEAELVIMEELGIELIQYKKVLSILRADKQGKSSSSASSIVEMLNYLKLAD